jgi:TonB family protein
MLTDHLRPFLIAVLVAWSTVGAIRAHAQDALDPRCVFTRAPDRMPVVGAVLDTTGLAAVMAFTAPERTAGELRFWLTWDSLGAPQTVRHGSGAEDGSEEHLLASLLAVRMVAQEPYVVHTGEGRRRQSRRVPWTARLTLADDWDLALAPTVECMPVLLNGEELERAIRQPLLVHAAPGGIDEAPVPGRTRRLVLRLHVGEDGTVSEVVLVRGSGDARLDRSVAASVTEMARFSPAVVSDRPVQMWVELPLVVGVAR